MRRLESVGATKVKWRCPCHNVKKNAFEFTISHLNLGKKID